MWAKKELTGVYIPIQQLYNILEDYSEDTQTSCMYCNVKDPDDNVFCQYLIQLIRKIQMVILPLPCPFCVIFHATVITGSSLYFNTLTPVNRTQTPKPQHEPIN